MQDLLGPLCRAITQQFGTGTQVAAGVLGASLIAGLFLHYVVLQGLAKLFSKTRTDVDERLLRALRWPVIFTVVLLGAYIAAEVAVERPEGQELASTLGKVLLTIGLLLWTVLAMRVATILLTFASQNADRFPIIDRRTAPLFSNLGTVLVLGLALYLGLLIWQADPTGWLASAGIVGVAVGFAAKDTLSNLFAGVFIIADAPYQLGDYVVLDDGVRGEVVHIGLRSTRVQTRDDVFITIPNSVIGTSKIVNQSGGRHTAMRVQIPVGVGYDSDVREVKRILQEIGEAGPNIIADPAPRVRFRRLGDSALEFDLCVWVSDPAKRGETVDAILTEVVDRFRAADIEIPFPQRSLHIASGSIPAQ